MALLVRVVDEIRFGLRELDVDELAILSSAWSVLNAGMTPAEIGLRLLRDAE